MDGIPMTETIRITGMHCGGCVNSVKNALGRAGASDADVEIGRARISYDESKISHRQLVEAIEDAGFEVEES
jgi:copper chaperone